MLFYFISYSAFKESLRGPIRWSFDVWIFSGFRDLTYIEAQKYTKAMNMKMKQTTRKNMLHYSSMSL